MFKLWRLMAALFYIAVIITVLWMGMDETGKFSRFIYQLMLVFAIFINGMLMYDNFRLSSNPDNNIDIPNSRVCGPFSGMKKIDHIKLIIIIYLLEIIIILLVTNILYR